MTIAVLVGGWEHECCGPEIERYQRVQWTYLTDEDGRFFETHHALDDVKVTRVSGTQTLKALDILIRRYDSPPQLLRQREDLQYWAG